MCKVEMLRVLVKQRLTAAVEEIFVVLERTIAEYEEELSRTKEENERQRQLLDALFNKHQQTVGEEHLPPDQQYWTAKMELEEAEPPCIKEEDEEADISKFPVIGVTVKSDDDEVKGESEEKSEAEPPNISSTQHMTTEAGGGSQADLAPLSDSDETTSHSPDTDDEDSKADAGVNPFPCLVCGKAFTRNAHLISHKRTHTGEKPFVCSACGKKFSEKGSLKKHTRTHTGEKPFSCSVCKTSFSDHSALARHRRIHTGQKPFSCAICNANFRQRTALVIHTRRHTGEKPFSCSVCQTRFRVQTSLIQHMRTHTGEKPFGCTVCDKRFSQKSTLTEHARLHTGEKPFACSVCDRSFSYHSSFIQHRKKHTRESLAV
ncbi:uncharacterized protein [Nerophis lumbriciformis]|uniref:uncharacterized protein isoform X2 n=1 Tax=Nerophis lumbriciformis TaxID=546530 RepID=UPI002ADFA748|nr:zinc finger protein OZF-like isoform X2 [Nerophis lumbriciformis]